MLAITTHILDTSRGTPAAQVEVSLEALQGSHWQILGHATTDGDGRIGAFNQVKDGGGVTTYRLTFASGAYFARMGNPSFFPSVSITFTVEAGRGHYHVPLLLSPYGYSTYRGS